MSERYGDFRNVAVVVLFTGFDTFDYFKKF